MDDSTHILALDTATKIQAVAVLRGQTPLEDVRHRVAFDHGSSLLTNVSEALAEHDLQPADLDAIAVGIGPGSFTGLRISLALAKGLAISRDIPLVGVSSLAGLALPFARSFPNARIVPAYDARRKEVFCAEFGWRQSNRGDEQKLESLGEERAVPADRLREELESSLESPSDQSTPRTNSPDIVLVGNGPHTYDRLGEWDDPRVYIVPDWLGRVSAVSIGLLGMGKHARSGGDDISAMEPNYIRPSSAEEAKQAGELPEIPT